VLSAFLALGTLVLLSFSGSLSAPAAGAAPRFAGLIAAFVVSERFVVHLPGRRSTHTLTFAELPLVLGCFLVDPMALVAANVLGGAVALAFERTMPAVRRVLNLAMFGASTALAALMFRLLAGSLAAPTPRTWAAALAATLAASIVGVAVIALGMTFAGERPGAVRIARVAGAALGVTVCNTSLALSMLLVAWVEPWGVLLLAGPLAAVYLGYRIHLGEIRRREQLELVARATAAMTSATDVVGALRELLVTACDGFHCSQGELVLLGDSEDDPAVEVDFDAERDPPLRSRRRVLPNAEEHEPGPDAAGASRRDRAEAELVQDGAAVGRISLSHRLDQAGPFGNHERSLLSALANQASMLVQYGRTRHALAGVERQASTDPLTGLANRRELSARLACGPPPRAVLALDLDHFKAVNDTLGHDAGDQLLVAVAARLSACVEPEDLVVRLGGDEFVVVIADRPAAPEPLAIGEGIVASLGRPFALSAGTVRVGASVGVADRYAARTREADALLSAADDALYRAKRAGRGRVAAASDLATEAPAVEDVAEARPR